jgi:hypothetical protein
MEITTAEAQMLYMLLFFLVLVFGVHLIPKSWTTEGQREEKERAKRAAWSDLP